MFHEHAHKDGQIDEDHTHEEKGYREVENNADWEPMNLENETEWPKDPV